MKSRQMVSANGLVLCQQCAMKSYIGVSKEFRPLVWQWVEYKNVRSVYACSRCGH